MAPFYTGSLVTSHVSKGVRMKWNCKIVKILLRPLVPVGTAQRRVLTGSVIVQLLIYSQIISLTFIGGNAKSTVQIAIAL